MKKLFCATLLVFSIASLAKAECRRPTEAAWMSATPVLVTLSEFKITPKVLTLEACRPYILTLDNDGRSGHNYMAEEFFSTVLVKGEGSELRPLEIGFKGAEVASGNEREMALIATKPGRYEVRCTHFLHSLFGMHGEIDVVEP